MNKKLLLWIGLTLVSATQVFAQAPVALEPWKYHVFSMDSLAGFDEEAAKASAISEGFLGDEFPYRMWYLKREYINAKYDLVKPHTHSQPPVQAAAAGGVVPACTNEDFEASDSGTITTSNQILGWTVTAGKNQGSGNNSCNLNGCCPQQPAESMLIDAPNGWIDSKIGQCYPIYSVFGDGPANNAANAANPHIPFPMKGNKFIRINSDNNNYSIEKLSKSFSVTPANALFQFAFISVFSTGHGCCDAGAFKISLPGMTCPTFSASAPSAQCTNTASGVQFLAIPSCTPYNPNGGFVNYIFNAWQISSMDLTAYIGQTVTIEIVATDCTAGGHFGYVYFDAQCGPMAVLGNGVPFPAGSPDVTVPTCGPNGATICATPGLGPYSWAGPNIPSSYSTPHYTNQCFTTSVSATYTLYMNPPGGCAPFTRIVHTTVTPAPTMVGSVKQAQCGDTMAVVTVTTGGSAGNPQFIQWFPNPFSLTNSSTTAQYQIPKVGQPTMVVTVGAADQIGCPVTITLGVNPPAPIPTFTIQNDPGTFELTCNTPTINLTANTNYTYGPATFFWASASFTANTQTISVTQPGTFVVTLTDAISKCAKQDTIIITSNVAIPSSSVNPQFQNISCVSGTTVVTLTSLSPTVNIQHIVMSPLGGSFVANNPVSQYPVGTTGTYTHILVNLNNGCTTAKQFSVTSTEGFPVFNLQSNREFTIGCFDKNWADINILNAQATPSTAGAVSYTLLAPGASSSLPSGTLSTQAAYTVTTPGTYIVVTRNNANGCDTRLPISIITNTTPPSIDTIMVPGQLLNCFTPSVVMTGESSTKDVTYRWFLPDNTTQPGASYTVNADFGNTTQTVVGTYTFEVRDESSHCLNNETRTILQNLYPPIADISGEEALACNNPTVLLSNNSTWEQNYPFTISLPIVAYLWRGPSPMPEQENTSSYLVNVPGTYTMYVRDMNNGCISTATTNLEDNFNYPILYNSTTPEPFVLNCGEDYAPVTVDISNVDPGTPPAINWYTVSIQGAWNAVAGTPTMATLLTAQTGTYGVTVMDVNSGCVAEVSQIIVLPGDINVDFEADKLQGYAPLTVNFTNLTNAGGITDSIQSVWVFGNSVVVDSMITAFNTTYSQPGTYTVTLFAARGGCMDTAFKIITVDIPSEMVIPNVFSPNGDGVNDIFHLQRSSNLSQIKATIYDRWGNLVYELDSPTGQISWDGLNQYGKESPAGTYFYIITATGRDGKAFDQKGTLTLVR